VGLPLCQFDPPDVSARLITSEKGSVIVLINTSGKPLTKVNLTLRESNRREFGFWETLNQKRGQ